MTTEVDDKITGNSSVGKNTLLTVAYVCDKCDVVFHCHYRFMHDPCCGDRHFSTCNMQQSIHGQTKQCFEESKHTSASCEFANLTISHWCSDNLPYNAVFRYVIRVSVDTIRGNPLKDHLACSLPGQFCGETSLTHVARVAHRNTTAWWNQRMYHTKLDFEKTFGICKEPQVRVVSYLGEA